MRIAIIGKFYTEGQGLHVEEAFHDMGHDTVRIDPEIQFLQYNFLGQKFKSVSKTLFQQVFYKIPYVRNIKSKEILSIFKKNKIDFTLVLHDYLMKEEVNKIKEITNSPVVLWFPDPMSNFQKSMFFIAGYDHLFFCDKYIVNKLKEEYELNTFYLPQCFSKFRHKMQTLTKQEEKTYKCDITNIGNIHPPRAALYKKLLDYDFKMWGYPPAIWMDVRELDSILMCKSLFNEEKSKAFGAAKIVLNNMHPDVVNGVNKRLFEIPACGGFQITGYRDTINDLFEIGKEIVCYKNYKDLRSKLDYYLDPSNEQERQTIVKAGWKKSQKMHTYQHRLIEMLSIVFKN